MAPPALAGDFDPGYVARVNRSHVTFNTLRLACSLTLFSSVPVFLLWQPLDPVQHNAAYLVFPPALGISSLVYGRWISQDSMLFYRQGSAAPLMTYHTALEILKRENDWNRPLSSLGVNSLLLILGGIFLHLGSPSAPDWKSQLLYSAGLGLSLHSGTLISLDLAEIVVRLTRRQTSRDAWIRLNI